MISYSYYLNATSTDLAAEHAIGGIIGLLFNGLFADGKLVALDNVNTNVQGGWIRHHYKQLYIQFAYVCATVGYAFVVTAVLAKTLDSIPFLRLRSTSEEEALGMDDVQVRAYSSFCAAAELTAYRRLANLRRTTSKCAATIQTGRQRTRAWRLPLQQATDMVTQRPQHLGHTSLMHRTHSLRQSTITARRTRYGLPLSKRSVKTAMPMGRTRSKQCRNAGICMDGVIQSSLSVWFIVFCAFRVLIQ